MRFKTFLLLLAVGFFSFLIYLLGPYLAKEIEYYSANYSGVYYSLDELEGKATLKPVNPNFSLMIMKLGINQRVFSASLEDQTNLSNKLKLGPVHLSESALPGRMGKSVFLLHPPNKTFNLERANPGFYLLYKLKNGDLIDVFYQKIHYRYQVVSKNFYSPEQVSFDEDYRLGRGLTLIAGFPPGTMMQFLTIETEEVF